ncbi:MAG: hypothetical protein G01um101420_885 [Parcubacteria group bacterium Gr01-1014_20]|nr:MAG: hypothetical protein G01um101420_885 [Parcubacteria group bacterium Gr01-1014_20]
MNLNIPEIARIELFRTGGNSTIGILEKIIISQTRALRRIRSLLNQEVEKIPFFPSSGPGNLPTYWINVYPSDGSKPFQLEFIMGEIIDNEKAVYRYCIEKIPNPDKLWELLERLTFGRILWHRDGRSLAAPPEFMKKQPGKLTYHVNPTPIKKEME